MAFVRKTQYIVLRDDTLRHVMTQAKDETISIRTSSEIKQLLKEAAAKEHRSQASMIEILILDYAKQHGLCLEKSVAAADHG